MSRFLEFILSDGGAQLPAKSDERTIRNADKIGFATVDADVNGVDGMNFVRQQIASGKLKDGDVWMCAVRYNQTVDAIKPATAARSLDLVPNEAEATDAEGAEPGAPEEADEIPF